MPIDRAQTARGALAGAVAAAVWAAQQPLDMRLLGARHDDTELLGKAVTRRRGWRAAGIAMHVANGALFGALYSQAAPRMPLPSWARGPAAALAEHLVSWPLTVLAQRLHPAAGELPPLAGTARAFAQATWRHLLFGVVLGELERRLNAPEQPDLRTVEEIASTNGHGDLEAALSGAR
jgi:hypothetical protein